MATEFTLVAEGGGMFPQSSLVNKFATPVGIALSILMGSTGTTYTITSTDKTTLGLIDVNGINLIGTEARVPVGTGTDTIALTMEYNPDTEVITFNGTPEYKPITLAIIGKPSEPIQKYTIL